MPLDFTEVFTKYEKLVAEVEQLFEKVRQGHAEEVRCGRGCSDCCYALFDLSLVESIYLNHHFNRLHKGAGRSAILTRADEADRTTHIFKRRIFKATQDGVPAAEILAEVARERIRCPLLNGQDLCDLYEHRPITCRLYGLPMAIGGETRTCGQSGFTPGKAYPTVHMDRIQDRLTALSKELVEGLRTKHAHMWDMLIPPSMALMTDFDEKYLGAGTADEAPAPAPTAPVLAPMAQACSGCDKDAQTCGGCESTGGSGGCTGEAFSVTIGQAPERPKAAKPKKPRSPK